MAKFNLHNFKLKLKSFFDREAKTLIRAYQSLIERKRGVSNDSAPNNTAYTIRKKGFDHWMKETGKLKSSGFAQSTTETSMEVYANPGMHPTAGKTYAKLFMLHNDKSRYSGIFGQLPIGSKLLSRMEKEMVSQVKEHIFKNTPRVVRIK